MLIYYYFAVKNNPDISKGYIFYQSFMMFGTVFGPGSIFLMLIGAFSTAFSISNDTALIINAVLVGGFVLACCLLKSKDQIRVAEILTVVSKPCTAVSRSNLF